MTLRDEGFVEEVTCLMIHNRIDEAILKMDGLSSQLYRQLLNAEQRRTYDLVVDAMKHPETDYDVPPIDPDRYYDLLAAVRYDHPYLFALTAYHALSGGRVVTIEFRYSCDIHTIRRLQSGVLQSVLSYRSSADIDPIDSKVRVFQKIWHQFCKSTHWSKIDPVRYGPEVQDLVENTMVGPFLYQSGVCGGLSYAFCALLQAYGFPSCVAVGKSLDSTDSLHAWNIVQIAPGIRGHIDVQNAFYSERTNCLYSRYHGFLISDESMSRKYNMEAHPKCVGAAPYYFEMLNRYVITEEDVYRALSHSKGLQSIDLMIEPRRGSTNWILEVLQECALEFDLRDYTFNDSNSIITIKIGESNEDRCN